MARPYSAIGVQLGLEATAGTLVPANRRLLGIRLDAHNATEAEPIRPSGFLVPSKFVPMRRRTEADWEGNIDYRNILYPLSSLFGDPVSTQPDSTNAPSVYEHVYTFTGKGATTPQTYTVEVGDDSRAARFGYAAFTGMDLSVSNDGDNTMSGSMVGQGLETGVTMTPTPTEIEVVPATLLAWDVYADPTSAALGSTKLENVYNADLSFSDLFSEEYVINSEKPSFNTLFTAAEPTFDWSMNLQADAVAEAYFEKIENSEPTFIRLAANGPVIEDALNYSIEIDMCVGVTSFEPYGEEDELYAFGINFGLVYDSTWAKAMQITVRNDLATL